MYKFNDDILDNLIQFESDPSITNPKLKFKEIDSLVYLIKSRWLLVIIPIYLKKESLMIKSFKNDFEWINYINNEFKNWALKNNITNIKFYLRDKPDLKLIINHRDDEAIGIELGLVFPFFKNKKKGDIFKKHEAEQHKIFHELWESLMNLKLHNKMPKIKICDGEIIFSPDFISLEDKEKIINAINSVKNWKKINPISLDPVYYKCPCNKPEHVEFLATFTTLIDRVGKNIKDKLKINNYEPNLINYIKQKNKQVLDYSVEKNSLLLLVENIDDFVQLVFIAENNSNKMWKEARINDYQLDYYFQTVYLKAKEAENKNLSQIVIIYKHSNFVKHIFVLKE